MTPRSTASQPDKIQIHGLGAVEQRTIERRRGDESVRGQSRVGLGCQNTQAAGKARYRKVAIEGRGENEIDGVEGRDCLLMKYW